MPIVRPLGHLKTDRDNRENYAIGNAVARGQFPLKVPRIVAARPLQNGSRPPYRERGEDQLPGIRSIGRAIASDGPGGGGLLGWEAGAAGGAWTFGEGQATVD